jgi:hypothetical protein
MLDGMEGVAAWAKEAKARKFQEIYGSEYTPMEHKRKQGKSVSKRGKARELWRLRSELLSSALRVNTTFAAERASGSYGGTPGCVDSVSLHILKPF